MKISPDNPHLKELTTQLIDESLGRRAPSKSVQLWLGQDALLDTALQDFVLLTDEERSIIILGVIRSSVAQKKYTDLVERLSSHT